MSRNATPIVQLITRSEKIVLPVTDDMHTKVFAILREEDIASVKVDAATNDVSCGELGSVLLAGIGTSKALAVIAVVSPRFRFPTRWS